MTGLPPPRKRIVACAMTKEWAGKPVPWGVEVQIYDVEQELQRLDTAIPDTMIELRLQYLDTYLRFKEYEQNEGASTILQEIARCVSLIANQVQNATIANQVQNATHQLSLIREIMKDHTDIFNIEIEGGEDVINEGSEDGVKTIGVKPHDNLRRS